MKRRSDCLNFIKNLVSQARYDYDTNEYTDYDIAELILNGIEDLYMVKPYLAEDDELINIQSYLQGPFVWGEENK